jgi:hypothetical protein
MKSDEQSWPNGMISPLLDMLGELKQSDKSLTYSIGQEQGTGSPTTSKAAVSANKIKP